MKEILLKSLNLKNFKGIKDLHIDFSKITNIFGDNGTGKTSIADAFTWLLFDKDSLDRVVGDKESNFQIKTHDKDGNILHGLEHGVTGILAVNGKDITLSKVYKEKWTKRRGEAERNLTGHETLYYIDEVPVKKSEFQEKINSIINEQLFKLITNPLYFSTNMKWQDRRDVLLNIIGDITAEKIINYKSDLKPLLGLLEDKDIDTLKKSVQARKRKLNDEIKSIPYRVDECNNSIKEIDFDALEFRKRGIVTGIKSLEEQLLDSSKVNEEVLKEKDRLYSLKSKLRDMEYKASIEADKPKQEIQNKLNSLRLDIRQIEHNINSLKTDKQNIENDIERYQKLCAEERDKWFEENKKTFEFDESNCVCPTCKRAFDSEQIESKREELEQNFKANKEGTLSAIQNKGKLYKRHLEEQQEKLKTTDSNIEASSKDLWRLKSEESDLQEQFAKIIPTDTLSSDMKYKALKTEIEALEKKVSEPTTVNNQSQELKERKSKLEFELEDVNSQLAYKEQNEKLKARIAELQQEEKKLAQQIAALEGQEFLCEEFIKTKVELLESSINNKFKYVSFKLFNTQVNGGLDETCEALINGVPFSNANTASQYNAGMDILNTLCDYYGVQAPILIDGRESVNNLIETNSQIINLIVSKDTNLRIERQISILEEAREIGEKFGIKYEEVEEI